MSSSALEASGFSPANRPPPQMALATAAQSRPPGLKRLCRNRVAATRLNSISHFTPKFGPRAHFNAAAARLILALFRPIVPPPYAINIRRWARLLCRLEVTKVQVPTLYLGNLDKARPCATLELGAVRPWLTRRGTCPDAPKLG